MSDTDNTSRTDPIDAVFVIGTGSKNNNEELKYALRNLEKNCPFVRDVYISGECPSWVNTSVVKHLRWPDRFTHAKDANIVDKLRHACEHKGIAKRILFCSDDQFQTRVCTWDDFSPRWLRRYTATDTWYQSRKRLWHERLRRTLERDRVRRESEGLDQADVFYYQPHMWMQIDRDKFIEYAKWCEYEKRDDTIIASGYFNFIDAGGASNFDHVFINANQKWPVKVTHVAYTDSSFNAAMKYLKEAFPEPSVYEVGAKKAAPAVESVEPAPEPDPEPAKEPRAEPPKPSGRTDSVIIEDVKRIVGGEEVWSDLMKEIEVAEAIRLADFSGWKKVWNDIIHRWNVTTEKGRLHLPVTLPPSEAAVEIIEAFKSSHPDKLGSSPEDGKGHRKCSKCEERRRKAEEARKAAAEAAKAAVEEAAAQNAASTQGTDSHTGVGAAVVQPQPPRPQHPMPNMPMHRPVVERFPQPPAPVAREVAEDDHACLDCAIDHLSSAIAYLGVNAGRPGAFETALAKGEVKIAAQHLLALKRNDEYNRCVDALDSVYSQDSRFSESTFLGILKSLMDN